MDEPTFDELEWMAMADEFQESISHNEENYPDDDLNYSDGEENQSVPAKATDSDLFQGMKALPRKSRLPSAASNEEAVVTHSDMFQGMKALPRKSGLISGASNEEKGNPGITKNSAPSIAATFTDSVPDASERPAPPTSIEDPMEGLPPIYEDKKVHRQAVDVEGSLFTITYNGERVYTQLREETQVEFAARPWRSFREITSPNSTLLSEPISDLMDKIESERFDRAIKESRGEATGVQLPDQVAESYNPSTDESQLWVDKYSPKSFTELLSDEKINREVLAWLKKWDPCVFGRRNVSTSDDVLATLRRKPTVTHTFAPRAPGSGPPLGRTPGWSPKLPRPGMFGRGSQYIQTKSASWQARGERKQNDWAARQSKNLGLRGSQGKDVKSGQKVPEGQDRPEEKVILLCGPPGLGKTTLAHVAARHCGYRVVEVNASDDRSAESLKSRVLDAVQMQSVAGDKRPNCVIIDEIDGALSGSEGKGAMDALLDIINSDLKLGSRDNSEDPESAAMDAKEGKKSRKKKSGIKKLNRPIICICNDLYAPVLRPLRQVARIFNFSAPVVSRVVARLRQICETEKFKTDSRSLSALATHTECDIRSCLNTLQFLHRKGKPLLAAEVASQVIGRKDLTRSMFDIWQEIFQKKAPLPLLGSVSAGSKKEKGEIRDFDRLYSMISTHGEHDLVTDGVHENILRGRHHDSSLEKTVACLDWLGDGHIWDRKIMASQQFGLAAYRAAPFLAIRRHLATPERPNLEWPKTSFNNRSKNQASLDLMSTWRHRMKPTVAQSLHFRPIVLDVLSPLLTILSPPLRPVVAQLLSAKEKSDLVNLVDTMIALGLSFKAVKRGDADVAYGMMPQWQLDPPIGQLIGFEGHKAGHRQLTPTVKQMIAHEIELEVIRRDSALRKPDSCELTLQDPTGSVQGMAADSAVKEGAVISADVAVVAEQPEEVALQAFILPPKKLETLSSVVEKVGVKRVPLRVPFDYFARFKKSKTESGSEGNVN